MTDPALRSDAAPRRLPPVRDAATLIVIDRAGAVPKVLMGRRHAAHAFMPGKFVFPGGRVEAADALIPVARLLPAPVELRLMRRVARPSRARARAIALAAIRETFEETGLLIGRDAGAVPPSGAPSSPLAVAGLLPDLGALHFIARAVTPPRYPRRFDTRFFAADAEAIACRVEGIVGAEAELVEMVWVPIAEAKDLDLPTVTRAILEQLELRIAAGLGHDLPVPFYGMRRHRFLREML